MTTALATWDRLKQDLAEAHSVDELRVIRDRAEALRQYAKRQKESLDMQNKMAEITLRCERRMGEMLQEMPKNKGNNFALHGTDTVSVPPRLEDIGISHKESSRCQAIARLPDEVFEQHIGIVKERREELTQASLLQLAKREQRARKEQEREQKRDENRQEIARARTIEEALGTAKFSTIVIDPPWDWGDEGDIDQMGRARPTYGTMPIADLLALPVGTYADTNSHLYLWITNRSLPKGFQLLDNWGFRYVTCITWVKPSFGMGNYFRGQTEHLLFGVKGSQPLKRKDAPTYFEAPRGPNGHSSKPVEAYPFIESCSPGPYLELFARSRRPDWISWGAEA